MKILLNSVLALSLSCCTVYHHVASVSNKNGVVKYEEDTLVQGPGGTASQKGADGSSIVADNQQSARDIAQAAGAAYGLHEAQVTNASNNLKDLGIGHQGVQNNAIKNPIQSTSQSVDPATGQVLNSTSSSFAPVFGTHK